MYVQLRNHTNIIKLLPVKGKISSIKYSYTSNDSHIASLFFTLHYQILLTIIRYIGKTNKILHDSSNEHLKINDITKFGGKML